jgi:hypothetical protein
LYSIQLNRCNLGPIGKICSIDTSLLSYAFLIRFINRIFDLHSNFTIIAEPNSAITDDFDLDNYLISFISIEPKGTIGIRKFVIDQYDIDDWCIIDDDYEDNFDLIELERNITIVTMKPTIIRHETFLQRATSWFHGTVHSELNKCVTKKEFCHMFDTSTGRLLDEHQFRQRIFDDGCEPSIRHIVWCYLLRIFDSSMTYNDRQEYNMKAKQRYNE